MPRPARAPWRTASRCYRPDRRSARRPWHSPGVSCTVRIAWRRAVPDARLLVGGADAPGEVRASEGREGVEVVSPVTDMAAFLRRARVVALPVDFGTGTPN